MRCIVLQERLPAIRLAGWAQYFAHEAEARPLRFAWLAPRHVGDILPRGAELGEQLRHAGLRMLWML